MRGAKIFFFSIAILFINTLFLLQISSAFSDWSKKTSGFSVELKYNEPLNPIIPFRMPGRNSDYLIGRQAANTTYPRSVSLRFFSPFKKNSILLNYIKHMLIRGDFSFSAMQEIRHLNNGEPVLPLFGDKNRKLVLELRDIKGTIVKKNNLEDLSLQLPRDGMDKSIIAIEDIDADGRDEMLWRISGEFAGLPRGYAVHDPLTGKKKWEFLCGSTPFRTSVKDIDGDGKKEIFFSVKAPHNNVSYNNMSDDTSYIGELDCYGNLKWCLPAGGFFSQLFMKVEDLERDGKFEMITARSCHREENPDPGQIRVYDAMTGKILYTFNHIGVSFTNLHVVNMNDDSNLEIVTEDSEGGIRIWDYKLGLCEEYKGNKDLKILGVEKVQGYDYPLIFTWYSFNTLRIFDHRLRVVFDHRFPKDLPKVRDPIVPVSDGENTSYLFSTDRTYTISPGKTNRFQDYLSLFGSRFSYYLLGVLVFNGLLYAGWLQRKRLKAHSLELLREGAKSSPEWMTVAQEALHKMKSPLTAILWETEKIDGLMEKKRLSKTFFSKLREINEAILADVNELKLMNRFLMKIMQAQNLRMQQIDINNVILSLVEDYRKRYGGKFTFSSGEFQKLPPVEADEEQLTEAFAIIIDNAVDAVPEGGTVSISAVYRKNMPGGKQQNVVEVAVEDNGCGIPDDKQDRIFEPYFTTKKEGTGIGLAIAKRIVESHDGWIEMESRENVGTKFALYFPLKRLDRDKH